MAVSTKHGQSLLKSRLTGRIEFQSERRALITHVLGNRRLLCDLETATLLDYFEKPRTADALLDFATNATMRRRLSALFACQLLSSCDTDEAEQIRKLYAVRFVAQADERWTTALEVPSVASRRSIIGERSVMQFASGLAVLPLENDEVLVTHPLGRRLHLAGEMWELARSFQPSRQVHDVLDEHRRKSYSREQLLAACDFLRRHRILWPSLDDERLACEEYYALTAPHQPVHIVEWEGHEWEQKFRAYRIADTRIPRLFSTVAAVGVCQLHAHTPALLWMAEQVGLELDVRTFATPTPRLAETRWDAVLTNASQYAAHLLGALALSYIAQARDELPRTASHIDHHIDQIRSYTTAPILLHSIGHPGLSANGPFTGEMREAAAVLEELNRRIYESLKRHQPAFMLDEDRLSAMQDSPIHWDDEFNGVSHHSCVSLWGRPPRRFSLKRPALTDADRIPPVPARQREPAIPGARAYLDFLLSYHETESVRLILINPDGLLWPGKLHDRQSAHPTDFNFYTGDYYSLFIGINEALVSHHRRGVAIVGLSALPTETLAEKWQVPQRAARMVRYEDVMAVWRHTSDIVTFRERFAAWGISETNALWLDIHNNPPTGFGGRVFRGSRWDLRRYLLTAPELTHLRDKHQSSATASTGSTAQHTAPVMAPEYNATQIDEMLSATACEVLNCTRKQFDSVDDLRLVGADSLRAMNLVARLEQRLRRTILQESHFVPNTLFSKSALLDAILTTSRQYYRLGTAGPSGLDDLSDAEWRTLDLRYVLTERARTSPVPWILKCVNSTDQGDHEYVTWRQLYLLARGYTETYQQAGLKAGDTITILIPQGLRLVAAIVGAILGRFVPAVCAFPSEKLSTHAFAEWFATLVKRSANTFMICDPAIETDIRPLLERGSIPGYVSSAVPSPMRRATFDQDVCQPDVPAILQYSSGTTGLKKVLRLSNRTILAQVSMLGCALQTDRQRDVIVSWLPLYHDMGFVASMLFPLLQSIPVVLMSPFDWVKNPAMLVREIHHERGTLCWMPNFAFVHMARHISWTDIPHADLGSLRAIINCSEPVTARALHAFYSTFSSVGLMRSALSSSYAMAEATFAVTQSTAGRSPRMITVDEEAFTAHGLASIVASNTPARRTRVFVSSGTPVLETEVRVVGPDGSPLPDGTVGEIAVRGPSVAPEYFADSDATRAAFRGGWYFTGDLGFVLEREVYVTGRSSDMMIVAGANVYPHHLEEVAAAVPGVHPGRIVAFGVFDDRLGTERVIVLVEALPDYGGPADDLKKAVREAIVTHCSVPVHDIKVVPRQTLLKSTSGKLSRRRNRELYLTQIANNTYLSYPVT